MGGSLCCLDPQPGDSGGPWRTPDAEGPTFCPLHPEEAFHDPSKTVPAPASHWQRRPLPLGKGPSLRAEGNAAALGPVPAPPRPLLTPATQSHSNPTSSPPAGPLYLLWPLPDALSDPTATRSKAPPAQTALPPGSPPSREPSLISRDVSSPGQARRAHPLHSHDAGVFSSAELYGPGDKATLGVGNIWHASQPSGRLGTGSDCWGEDVEKWGVRWAHHFLHVCRWGSSPNSSTVYRGGGCDD